ncbi:MAG: tetratricopeptide repeat protein, partial [Actinobacteria bacterium]|nr:tetratricopeptide repeat protein [Actinomycetota bacterium]
MRDVPAGTVTFLFTDVEGSTRLLHELGAEDYATALAEHRRLIRAACARQGGVEVDTQGDAFFFAFPTAPGALSAASAMTEALASGRVQVRIGLHTGTPLLTDEGYVGDEVHFAARVASSGHGGQILLSAFTVAAVEPSNSLLQGASLADLGEHRLKDIEGAVSIFQLGAGSFPPLKTISNTNLPRLASSFVGREKELFEVLSRIERGARLLTLTGPGGSGKTRLALEAASSLVPEYKAGVFWVGLSALRDPALVTETISQTLGAKDSLAEHIGEREMLLLLDNLEQVIEAAPELSRLLSACPNLTLFVTSRELLRVQGEVEYPVPPLAEPEAVSLFCERAQVEPTDEISELCVRLDKLPLAVELAAARVKALSPAQILERISQRLDLLKGGRDADPPQQTLRATIEWSYDLLSPEEQALFARLSVFAGGCTLEAAQEVADAELDTLQSLVAKSLLGHSNERFWMLETVRGYAGERLDESGHGDHLRRRHAEFCVLLAEDADSRMRSAVVLSAVAEDEGNLRSALSYCADGREPVLMLRLAGALSGFWNARDQFKEGCQWLEEAVQHADRAAPPVQARALRGLAVMTRSLGNDARARTLLDEALLLYRQVGDDDGVAKCLNNLGGLVWTSEGDLERATELFEESVALLKRLAEHRAGPGVAVPLSNLAQIAEVRGDFAEGRRLAEESLAAARVEENDVSAAEALEGLAWLALFERHYDAAAQLAEEALRIVLSIGALGDADSILIAVLLHA